MMGQVGVDRLKYSQPWISAQMDLTGPIKIKDFVNQRSSRKIWLLTAIDDFSRYISVTPIENLSKQALMNSLNQHFWRFGVTTKITADFATNFSSVAKDLEAENTLFETPLLLLVNRAFFALHSPTPRRVELSMQMRSFNHLKISRCKILSLRAKNANKANGTMATHNVHNPLYFLVDQR